MKRKKSNSNFVTRFDGRQGKKRLIAALLRQPLINGDKALASKISKLVKLIPIKANNNLTNQGCNDNDLYFILNGTVSIKLYGREIALRNAGEHVGEMALVDSTAKRSASIYAKEECIFAKLTEAQFSKLTSTYQDLWRQLTFSLVNRLRERNKFHSDPHSKPIIFIGSSTNGLSIATYLRNYLNGRDIIPRLWTNNVFEASRATIEDLMRQVTESDFAILILTPDDVTTSKGKTKSAPRDNVIFELGLFMGGINRERTYFVCPKGKDIKIPTDLLGVTRFEYKPSVKNLNKNLLKVKKEILNNITKLGSK